MTREQLKPYNPLEGPRPEFQINLHDGSEEQVSIIIVHKDTPEYLNLCLQSIAVTSYNSNYEMIVVDNGSTKQDSLDFLDAIEKEVKVVRNAKNEYWSAACNKGVSAADRNSKYLIFMHCDVVVLNSAWIDILINVTEAAEHGGCGMVGIELNHYQIMGQNAAFISEHVVLMTRECWNAIGPWPEQLPQIGHAFIMTMKAQHAGFKPQAVKAAICHHYRIFSLNINEYERLQTNAMSILPKLLNAIQTQPAGVIS